MAKRFTDTEKWKKRWIKELPLEYKLFWIYILDNCSHSGIWDVELDIANVRLGTDLSEKETISAFNGKIRPIGKGDKWFVPKFIDFQYGNLNPENRVHKSVIDSLEKEGAYKGLTSPSRGCKDKDKDKDKDKNKDIIKIPPARDDLKAYCKERGNKVDPGKFFDFYQSKGWLVGKTRMKDWKASVRNWEKSEWKIPTQTNQLINTRGSEKMQDFPEQSDEDREKVSAMISKTAKGMK